MQWDVLRVGRPYKRITVLGADFDPGIPADSFAVSDQLRAAFHATAAKPMHDRSLATEALPPHVPELPRRPVESRPRGAVNGRLGAPAG